MVKGNKFKTAEFLEKQTLKAILSKPPASAAATVPHAANSKLVAASAGPQANHRPEEQSANTEAKRNHHLASLAEVARNVVSSAPDQTRQANKNPQNKRSRAATSVTVLPPNYDSVAPTVKKQKLRKPALPTILAAPAPHGKAVNSNWAVLKGVVASKVPYKRQALKGNPASDRPAALKAPQQIGRKAGLTPVVALDCEMVGVGPEGTRSALARCFSLTQAITASRPKHMLLPGHSSHADTHTIDYQQPYCMYSQLSACAVKAGLSAHKQAPVRYTQDSFCFCTLP